jgi:hypothetical protein
MFRPFQTTSIGLVALFTGGLLLSSATAHALPSHLRLITFEGNATESSGGVVQEGYSLLPDTTTPASLEWTVDAETYFRWTQESGIASGVERWELTENDGDKRFNFEGLSVYNNDPRGSGLLFQGFVDGSDVPYYTYTLPAGLAGTLDFEEMFGGWYGLSKLTIEAAAPLFPDSLYVIDNIMVKHSVPDGGATAMMLGFGVLVLSSAAARRKQ